MQFADGSFKALNCYHISNSVNEAIPQGHTADSDVFGNLRHISPFPYYCSYPFFTFLRFYSKKIRYQVGLITDFRGFDISGYSIIRHVRFAWSSSRRSSKHKGFPIALKMQIMFCAKSIIICKPIMSKL